MNSSLNISPKLSHIISAGVENKKKYVASRCASDNDKKQSKVVPNVTSTVCGNVRNKEYELLDHKFTSVEK